MSIAFLNGQFLDRRELTLEVHDAGFVYGATITDFCRTHKHKLFRPRDHLERFVHDCRAIFLELKYTVDDLLEAAQTVVSRNVVEMSEEDDLALISFATPGPLPRMSDRHEDSGITVGMHTFTLSKDRYRRFFEEGVTLVSAGTHTSDSLVPASIKHRSRLHWWMAEQMVRLRHPGGVPVLFGPNADTPIGGILAVEDGVIVRAPRGTVLESITVKVVEELCERIGIDLREGVLDENRLKTSKELIVTGSGCGIAGVSGFWISQTVHKKLWPGPIFEQLSRAWTWE